MNPSERRRSRPSLIPFLNSTSSGKAYNQLVLTCVHCGEPIDHAGQVWFHPHRRFRGPGALPTMCDFGWRLGPTHATPAALTPFDKDFLGSAHITGDEESFLLEAYWLDWRRANIHTGLSCCPVCGATVNNEHALDCERRAPMTFEGLPQHQRCGVRH